MQLTTKSEWTTGNKNLGGISLISHLFNRLNIIYPGKIMHAYPTPEALREAEQIWAEYLAEDKVTGEEVKIALEKCRTGVRSNTWPPTYPEFLGLCRQRLNHEAAFHEAITQLRLRPEGKDKWSSPAIYWAAVEVGTFDIMRSTYDKIKHMWCHALDKHMIESKDTPVPEGQKRLGMMKGKRSEVSKKVAQENLAKIRQMLADSAYNKLRV